MSSRLGWQMSIRIYYYYLFCSFLSIWEELTVRPARGLRWAGPSSIIKPCGNTSLHPYMYSSIINSNPHLLCQCKETTFCPGQHNWKCKSEEINSISTQNVPGDLAECRSECKSRRLSLDLRNCCSKWWKWASSEEPSRNVNVRCCKKMGSDRFEI